MRDRKAQRRARVPRVWPTLALGALWLPACAAGPKPRTESKLHSAVHSAATPPTAAPAPASPREGTNDPQALTLDITSLPATSDRFAPPLPAELNAGAVSRATLLSELRTGIPHFLNRVQIEATRRRGSFWGWRIAAMEQELMRATVLRPGDVVHRINQARVERPEQLMHVWETLKAARELVLDVTRGDQPCRIRYRITDDSLAVTRH